MNMLKSIRNLSNKINKEKNDNYVVSLVLHKETKKQMIGIIKNNIFTEYNMPELLAGEYTSSDTEYYYPNYYINSNTSDITDQTPTLNTIATTNQSTNVQTLDYYPRFSIEYEYIDEINSYVIGYVLDNKTHKKMIDNNPEFFI